MKNFRFRAGDNIQTVSVKGEINLCYGNLQNSNIFAIYTCFTKGSDTKYLHITQRSIDQIETNLAESYRGP